MFSSRDDEEWIPATDLDRQAVLAQLERLIGPSFRDPVSPVTEEQRIQVLAQLERMLDDARFKFNGHYSRFLRVVVEKAVARATDQLTERNLGVEVFGRSADYDPNSDPIVRFTAAEIRDRIAQYYDQQEHAAELRIELPHGSYVPVFHPPASQLTQAPKAAQPESLAWPPVRASEEPERQSMEQYSPRRTGLIGVVWVLSVAVLGLLGVVAFGVAKRYKPDPVTSFWRFGGSNPTSAMICIPAVEPGAGVTTLASAASATETPRDVRMVAYSDVVVVTRISAAMSSAGLAPLLRGAGQTSLTELQTGPAVIIGGFENDWTLRLTESLPFRFVHSGDGGAERILDARSATTPAYSIDPSIPYSALTQDYGIVARFRNPLTEQPTVIVAGLGPNGTEAAANLVTSASYFQQFVAVAPKDWQKRNFELLLATQSSDGKASPPRILAAQYW